MIFLWFGLILIVFGVGGYVVDRLACRIAERRLKDVAHDQEAPR